MLKQQVEGAIVELEATLILALHSDMTPPPLSSSTRMVRSVPFSLMLCIIIFVFNRSMTTTEAFPQLTRQPLLPTVRQERRRQQRSQAQQAIHEILPPSSKAPRCFMSNAENNDDDEDYFYLTSRTQLPPSVSQDGNEDGNTKMNDDSLRLMRMMSTMRSSQDGSSTSSRSSNKNSKKERTPNSGTSLSASSSGDDEDKLEDESATSATPGAVVQDTLQPPSINWKRGSILFDESPLTAYSETQRGLEYWLWCQEKLPPVLTGIWPWRSDDIVQKTNEQPWQAMYNMLLVRLPAICLLFYIRIR